jgi:anti-anti-sigma regulatory factor
MERWIMIQIAQGWQLAVERGPGWLFVRPYNPFQSDDGLSHAEGGLAVQGIGLAGEETLAADDSMVQTAEAELGLAEQVWHLLEQNFTRRVVLELDQIGDLTSHFVGQLVSLREHVVAQGGVLRICGLSKANEGVLSRCGLLGRFLSYATRPDAVMGYQPLRPR